MTVSVNELLGKLRAVQRVLPDAVRNHSSYKGMRISPNGRQLRVYKSPRGDPSPPLDAFMQSETLRTVCKAEGLNKYGLAHRFQAMLQRSSAGEGVYVGENPGDAGTLGWFFHLDRTLVGIGSYHVLCPEGDASLPGAVARSSADGKEIGRVWRFDPAHGRGRRMFDCALIKIDDIRNLTGEMAPCVCAGGKTCLSPYPLMLTSVESIRPMDKFFLRGNRTTGCTELGFQGVGSITIPTSNGDTPMLYEQLFFDLGSDGGDSGAIVLHKNTNTVAGIVVGQVDSLTVASPLYRKPWKFVGLKTIGGITLPHLHSTS